MASRHRLAVALFAVGATVASAKDISVCSGFRYRGPENLQLSETEKRLVCGDPQNPAWSVVPDAQVQFHFRSFLQDRGFYAPKFSRDGKVLFAETGPPSDVRALIVHGEPETLETSFRADRMRGVLHQRLTPKFLDELEKRMTLRLGIAGYACAIVKTEADPSTGEVRANIAVGSQKIITSLEREPVKDVDTRAFERFDAFHVGDIFDSDALTVTSERVMIAGLVPSTHFSEKCEGNTVAIEQRLLTGPPRRVRFQIGGNTERLFEFRAGWRHTRIGRNASTFRVDLTTSMIKQMLSSELQWFPSLETPRRYYRTELSLRRENEPQREFYALDSIVAAGISADWHRIRWEFDVGPAGHYVKTVRGADVGSSVYATTDVRARAYSRGYERWARSPRSGWNTEIKTSVAQVDALSDASIRFLGFRAEKLWNLDSFDPPLFVFGIRGAANVLWSPEPPRPAPGQKGRASLTPFRQFLGGRADLRGFSLREVPGDDAGGFTAVNGSAEIRVRPNLPINLEPFFFIDVGAIGLEAFTLDDPLYWSPGGGLRWESPIGALRVSLAHGYTSKPVTRTTNDLTHWQLYFSLGEEF